MKSSSLVQLFRTKHTVFTTREVALIWGIDASRVRARLNYYVRNGKLYSPRRGFYALDKNYSACEFATKLFTPSYISLETVLRKEGVIFQYDSAVSVVSYLTREIACDGKKYRFKRVKPEVLLESNGIIQEETYAIATKERAFLDSLYLYGDIYFDNLNGIDWAKCAEMVPLYRNKAFARRFSQYSKSFKNAR